MKIQKIEIEKIRGIKKITIEPNGENIVIFGPNGSGKSAVIDAIDFLLTGKISRLEGEGTEELSTKKYGPHVDHELKEAIVKAEIKIPDIKDNITIERRMNNQNIILIEEKYKDLIVPILELSSLGQHLLSRREILKYIVATAGKRSEQIYAIMNLADIDKSRKILVSVKRLAERDCDISYSSIEKVKTDINILLGIKEFSEEECLVKINENRAILNAEKLNKLEYLEIKKDIKQPTGKNEEDVKNLKLLKLSIESITKILNGKNEILKKIFNIKEKITEIKKNIDIKKEIAYRNLIELGLNLIDDKDSCPLCEKYWDSQELIKFLNKRLLDSEERKKQLDNIELDAKNLIILTQKFRDSYSNLESNYKSLKLGTYDNEISAMINEFKNFIEILSEPIENQIDEKIGIINLISSNDCEDLIEKIKNEIIDIKYEVSPELSSWDILTKLQVYLDQYKSYIKKFEKAEKVFIQSKLSLSYFENARDNILDDMFDKINSNFVNFYKELHGEDEKDFKSSLVPDEAKLVFDVDFYKRGMFHPGAVHSEGHQDSMGVCLFLSLHTFLAEDKLGIIVLDDVVMSIDAKHRRNFCELLLKNFPRTQFIITTHDRVWAKQLRTEGVVKNKNMIEFKWWSIETGPSTGTGDDFWHEVEVDLNNDYVSIAAGKLRRNGECFLSDVCDLFKAKVVFKSDGNWEFGDYLKASITQYKSLIKCAKVAANSWGFKEKLEELKELDKKFTEIIEKFKYEQWAINLNIHYNEWSDFQSNDFKPVVNAFHELFDLFICKECGNIPQLFLSNMRWEIIKCPCGSFSWNLKEK